MSNEPPEDVSKERIWKELQELKSHVYPDRRSVLKGAVTAAGAGALGFSAGNATAANDTSAGNVGETGAPNDYWVDEIRDHGGDVVVDIDDTGDLDWQGRGFDNLGSVSTGELLGSYPTQARAIGDSGVVASIDPSSSGTPVQDAIDAITAEAEPFGTVLLPVGPVTENSQIDLTATDGIRITSPSQFSVLEFTDGTDKGFLFDDTRHVEIENLGIVGQQSGNADPVFDFAGGTGSIQNNVINRVQVDSWYGPFLEATGGSPFQNTIGSDFVAANNIDAGDSKAVISWSNTSGRSNVVGTFAIYPNDSVSGLDSTIYDDTGTAGNSITFRWLNIGGTTGRVASVVGSAIFHAVNYEPIEKNSIDYLFEFTGDHAEKRVWNLEITGGPTVEAVYNLDPGGRAIMVEPWIRGGSVTWNRSDDARLVITSSPPTGDEAYWFGYNGRIANDGGGSSGTVRSMDSAGGAFG